MFLSRVCAQDFQKDVRCLVGRTLKLLAEVRLPSSSRTFRKAQRVSVGPDTQDFEECIVCTTMQNMLSVEASVE